MEEIDFKRYMKPQYLAIVGIAAIAGYFIVSKRKTAQAETPTTEVITTERPVTDTNSTQAYDDLTRQLTDVQTKLNSQQGDTSAPAAPVVPVVPPRTQAAGTYTPAQIAQQQQIDIANWRLHIADADKRRAAAAQAAKARGAVVPAQFTRLTQAQLDALQPMEYRVRKYKELYDAIEAEIVSINALNAKAQAPTPQAPLPSTHPTPAPTTPVTAVQYPGLPDNYVMNCASAPQNLLYTDWASFKKNQTDKKLNSEQTARNLVSYALTGWGPSGGGATVGYIIGWDAVLKPVVQASMNQARVRGGLRPLNDDEFKKLSAEMYSLWPFNVLQDKQSQSIFHNYDGYAQQIWLHWNLPYQCPTAKRRF